MYLRTRSAQDYGKYGRNPGTKQSTINGRSARISTVRRNRNLSQLCFNIRARRLPRNVYVAPDVPRRGPSVRTHGGNSCEVEEVRPVQIFRRKLITFSFGRVRRFPVLQRVFWAVLNLTRRVLEEEIQTVRELTANRRPDFSKLLISLR